MKTIEQAAQKCAERIDSKVRMFTAHTGALEDFTPLIAAAMREVCEPLERDLKQMGKVAAERLEWHTQSRRERDQALSALDVAELEQDLREDRHLAKLADENAVLIKRVAELRENNAQWIQLLKKAAQRLVIYEVNHAIGLSCKIRAAIDNAIKNEQR